MLKLTKEEFVRIAGHHAVVLRRADESFLLENIICTVTICSLLHYDRDDDERANEHGDDGSTSPQSSKTRKTGKFWVLSGLNTTSTEG